MNGVITGGWEFIQAAYALTWIALTTYIVSVSLRHKKVKK